MMELDATLAAPDAAGPPPTLGRTQGRTTVLPRRAADGITVAPKEDRRFQKVRALGEGGMGEVTLALDEDIHRKVAIKRIRAEVLSEGALLRFADEVRIIGQLEHPSIIPVHDVGVDDDGQVYLVMKYVDGETLERIIERLRAGDADYIARYPIPCRVEILAKMLEALAYAHERGFVHRDLKPANIMVGPHGEVTLMDWGIAKRIGDEDVVDAHATTAERSERLVQTEFGSILGTPMYMSPEQAAGRNKELDARSDVFSASLLAHELFTLQHRMSGIESLPAMLATLLHKDLNEPEELRPAFVASDTPAELLWLCADGLARDPTKRYSNAAEMLMALRMAQSGDIRARCPITAGKAALGWANRSINRHPWIFMALLSLFVIGTAIAVIGLAWMGVRAVLG
jgi:serine/threonine protein kinase